MSLVPGPERPCAGGSSPRRPVRQDMAIRMPPSWLMLVIVVLPRTAAAACLLHDYSVRAEYARSSAVVIGEVVDERRVGESGGTTKVSATL